MLNQVPTEALNAATYVENYLDCVENFPDELQRLISRMRELDVCYLAKVKESHYWKKQADDNPSHKQRCYLRMQHALSAAQEIGDEKMSVVQTINDKIELRYKSLDIDFRNLDIGKEEQAPAENKDVVVPPTAASTNNSTSIMERPTKRARRGGRSENVSISENNHNDSVITEPPSKNPTPSTSNTTQKKTTAGKKKKRKSRQNTQVQREDNSPKEEVEEPLIDPDEPTYCLCDQISYGEMIMCDNDLCPIEWFHFSCVSLTTKPKGKWYCPKCRGDRPNVMKPKAQFLRELEKYNKEKEDKT